MIRFVLAGRSGSFTTESDSMSSRPAFRALSPNLRFASLMDMDFAVRCPLVRCLRLVFGFCPSTHAFARCFLQTPPRGGSPCTLLALHLHQVGQKTFTSKLLSIPSTQRTRFRGRGWRRGRAITSAAVTLGTSTGDGRTLRLQDRGGNQPLPQDR